MAGANAPEIDELLEGVGAEESTQLMKDLHAWQTREEFLYRHIWAKDMLVLWDNRSVLHRATGGYEGHDRLLHRTTIGAEVSAEA